MPTLSYPIIDATTRATQYVVRKIGSINEREETKNEKWDEQEQDYRICTEKLITKYQHQATLKD